jgi:hypothetical protein
MARNGERVFRESTDDISHGGFLNRSNGSRSIQRWLVKVNHTGYSHEKSDNIACKSFSIDILNVSRKTYPQYDNTLHCCC